MNDPDDLNDPHLHERMQRAVGGLRAPDVLPHALARGRRQRTHRRLAYAAGGVAAATALVITLPAVAGEWPGGDRGASTPPTAADPADPSPPTAAPGDDGSGSAGCGDPTSGWWSRSTAQIRADLSALLPADVRVGRTDDRWTGTWGGDLVTGGDADFASLTLLPPPGIPGGRLSLDELADGGPCSGGSNEPLQAVLPCAELTGYDSCEEIRSEGGELVGVVTERTEQTVANGRDQPTDRTYVLGTVAAPGGGHVELYVAEGTRADRPDTVHDDADVPALTADQVREIVADAAWTS